MKQLDAIVQTRARVLLLLFAFALASCMSAPVTPVQSLKLHIAEPGFYRLRRADLPAGFALSASNLAQLHLIHKGSELPLQVAQKDNDVEIIFYARPDESPYSATDVYWLTTADTTGARIQTRSVEPPRAPLAETVSTILKLEADKIYFPTAIGDTHWFWDSLTAPSQKTFTINLPALKPGEAQLQIALAGVTWGQHRVQALLNDQLIGEASWSGQTPHLFQAKVSNLRAGDNQLTLIAASQSELAAVSFLDSLTITYPREFSVVEDYFEFAGDAQNYRLSGFRADNAALYDVSDPRAVQSLVGFKLAAEGNTKSLSFYDNLSKRRYLALTPGALKKVTEVRAAQPNSLRATENHAAYLIIAPSAFRAALAPLVKHRSERGLAVQLVDIEQVYDAFSDGVPDPRALRAFLQYARAHWAAPAPRFVLLVGKASYDYRDNLKGPNKNLVPAFLLPTPHLGEAASDDWFALANENEFHPSMAIGRIPAKTPEQVSVAVKKIIAYDGLKNHFAQQGTMDWRRRSVFVTDNLEPTFDIRADALARTMASGIDVRKIYLSQYNGDLAAARAELIKQWNAGAQLMLYIGHGSINMWAAGPLFSDADLGAIQNGDRLPILLTPTCLDGFFYHPHKDSLAEELLFKSDGGIVAGLVPTGFSLQSPQDSLMNALFAELFAQPAPTLGEAIRNAKQKVAANLSEASDKTDVADIREVLQTFVLLGDPALKWELPK